MSNLLVFLLSYIFPRRYWYRNYYLKSKHWKEVRQRKLKQVKNRCVKCSKMVYHKSLDVHHLTYERLWHERLDDLQVLCREHHKKEHGQ